MSAFILAARSTASSWWLMAIIIGCGSVIAATLLAEHFARKRGRNPYLTAWQRDDREPGVIPGTVLDEDWRGAS